MKNVWYKEEYEYGKGLIERIIIVNVPKKEDLTKYNSSFNNLIIHKKVDKDLQYNKIIDFNQYKKEYIDFNLKN